MKIPCRLHEAEEIISEMDLSHVADTCKTGRKRGFMNYSIKLNAVNNPDKNVKAFATVTFGDCF